MNYLKMLEDIEELVNNGFCYDMSAKQIPKMKEYNQEEAKQMANIIGKIYLISHSIHCKACQTKYKE